METEKQASVPEAQEAVCCEDLTPAIDAVETAPAETPSPTASAAEPLNLALEIRRLGRKVERINERLLDYHQQLATVKVDNENLRSMLTDPTNLGEMVEQYLSQVYARAKFRVAESVPASIRSRITALKSAFDETYRPCALCMGSGEINCGRDEWACPECAGAGRIHKNDWNRVANMQKISPTSWIVLLRDKLAQEMLKYSNSKSGFRS